MTIDEKYPLALPRGSVLAGQYVIEQVLGQGGFGITYKATDHKTGQSVAIKEFFPDSMAARTTATTVSAFTGERGESFAYGKGCFLQEAETLAEFIGNEHIVRVFSYFEENGTAYFVMEFIEGTSFDQYIKDHGGKLPYEEAERILLPVIDALAAVHAKGIVHRDVTPDNIYITKDGTVKLLDFGAARYSLGDKSRSLDVVLKHGFAPKEQYTRHGKQGPYTDVYTVGASFYFAVTGKRPPDSIDRLEEDELIPPSSLGRIAPEKEDAILKAMSVQPANRFQTMGEFRQALMGGQNAAATPLQGAVQGVLPQPVQQRVFTTPQQPPQNAPQPIYIPQRNIPQGAVPQGNMPQQSMPQGAVPQGNMPQQSMPQGAVPQGNMPQQSMPQGAVPQGNMPQQNMPQGAVPQRNIPQGAVPRQPQTGGGKKMKWLLPVGIGAGGIAVAAAVILAAIYIGDSGDRSRRNARRETAHYDVEDDGGLPSVLPTASPRPTASPEPAVSPEPTALPQPESGFLQMGAASFDMLGEIQGGSSANITNGGCLAVGGGGIACWYPGAGLAWLGDTNSSIYDSTEGYIDSISIVGDMIYYVDADGKACSVGTDGSGIAYLESLFEYSSVKNLWVAERGYYFAAGSDANRLALYSCSFDGEISGPISISEPPVFYENDVYFVPADAPWTICRIRDGSSIVEQICYMEYGERELQIGGETVGVRGDGNFSLYVAAEGYLYARYYETGTVNYNALYQVKLQDGSKSSSVIYSSDRGASYVSANESGGYLYFAAHNIETNASEISRVQTACYETGEGTFETLWEGEDKGIWGITLHSGDGGLVFCRMNLNDQYEVVSINMDGSGEPVILSAADFEN